MNSLAILLGITITALTPTIAIIVTRTLDKRERADVADQVIAVADEAKTVAEKVRIVAEKAEIVAQDVSHVTTRMENITDRVEAVWVEQDGKLDKIHLLVNSRLTEALERIASLEKALGIASNAEVPEGPHLLAQSMARVDELQKRLADIEGKIPPKPLP